MTVTVMKLCFPKQKLKVFYRDYEKFCNYIFRAKLGNDLLKHDIYNIEYQCFLNAFWRSQNKHAPVSE